MQVLVRDNNVDQALKALKKKMQREGIFREMKLRGHYEKPSEKKAREKAEAVRRARKLARKRAQREGLIPMKPKIMPGGPGGRARRSRRWRPWRRRPRRSAVAAASAAAADLAAAAVSGARTPSIFRLGFPRRGRPKRRPALWYFGTRAIVERSPHSLGEQPGSRPAATEPRSIESKMTT